MTFIELLKRYVSEIGWKNTLFQGPENNQFIVINALLCGGSINDKEYLIEKMQKELGIN